MLDGEVGDDPGALSNGDHRTRPDQLIALCVSNQPASLSTGPPRVGIEVSQDEWPGRCRRCAAERMPSPRSKATPGEVRAARSCGRPARESAI